MQLRFELDREALRRIRDSAERRLPDARTEMVEQAMSQALALTSANNPVATGRSRAAWDAARSQLSGGAADVGRGEGNLSRSISVDTTENRGTNSVPYVRYLEYGTSRTAPFAMARRALTQVARIVASLFSWS